MPEMETAGIRKRIGVLGGMGAVATAEFVSMIVGLTDAACEQDHIRLIIDNDPTIPDRSNDLNGTGPSALPAMIAGLRRLEAADADIIVMPCNTAHAHAEAIIAASKRPFASIIDITLDEVTRSAPRASKVGVMAAEGCLRAGLYQDAVQARGLQALLPDGDHQSALIEAIYEVKHGRADASTSRRILGVAEHLAARGADVLVGACTELAAGLNGHQPALPFIDSSRALARFVVIAGGGKLRA